MRSLAIINIHPNIKSWNEGADPRDASGNPVVLDESAIATEIIRLEKEFTANQYQRDRAESFPSWQEQMDMQYHDSVRGTTTWVDAVAKVKADHPKG